MDFFTAVSSILNIIQYVFYLPTVTVGVMIGFACFVNLSSFGIGAVTESFVFVLIREMVDTVASFLYLPAFIINLIVLLISFGTFLHMSSSFLENLILTRYTETVRRSHLPKHRTPLKFAPSICFMGGKVILFLMTDYTSIYVYKHTYIYIYVYTYIYICIYIIYMNVNQVGSYGCSPLGWDTTCTRISTSIASNSSHRRAVPSSLYH